MNKLKIACIFLIIMLVKLSFGQLNLNTAMTPTQLVQNVLLGGGVTVSNVTYTGGPNSRASFSNGNTTNIGLTNGLVLCTGNVSQINNPASILMSNNLGLAGDADLDAINNGCQTYDACILQFDFVPLSDTVRFRYVFGSEEYPNYVCSIYNDVFAFFLTGQNPSGGNYNDYNIALIPGTSIPVSVNSINNGIPGGSYSSSGCTSLAYSNFFEDNAAMSGQSISFGGFTTPLTAVCHVIPCETYHIKIAVADGYNGLYDSGVFLEANSFTANTYSVNTSYSDTTLGNFAVEGCSNGIVSFELTAPATSPYIINYTLSGTATNGTDYSALSGTITIPVGQDSTAIIINPAFDGIIEGFENVIISYNNGCLQQSDTIFIANANPIALNLSNDTTLCSGDAASITAIASGGTAPYTYSWSTSQTLNTISVTPIANTSYTVTVSDFCSRTATGVVNIDVNSITSSITTSNEFCNQGNGTASANATGVCNSTYSYNWSNGANTQNISNLSAGNYTVTVTCGNCISTSSASILNLPGPSVSVVSTTDSDCGQDNGQIETAVTNGAPPYTYNWNTTPAQTSQSIQNLPPGNYTLTVTDANNCTSTTSAIINQLGGPVLVMSSSSEMCGQGNGIASVSASQGTGTYTYVWSTNPLQTNSTISNLSAGSYTVTVDDGNCFITGTVTVGNNPGASASLYLDPQTTTLMDGAITFSGISDGIISNWLWDFGDGQVATGQSTTHQYDNLGEYPVMLITSDINGCIDTAFGTANIIDIFTLYVPNSFSPDGDGLNDVFIPQGLSVDPDYYEMLIFNRWGNLVFQTTTWGEGWNGSKYNSGTYKDAINAVYVYKIYLRELSGDDHEYYGKVVLFK